MKSSIARYKLRFLQKNNKSGDTIGISLPKQLYLDGQKLINFIGVKFTCHTSGTAIILQSGAEIQELQDNEFNKYVKEEEIVII